jgi:hypothetical protein
LFPVGRAGVSKGREPDFQPMDATEAPVMGVNLALVAVEPANPSPWPTWC